MQGKKTPVRRYKYCSTTRQDCTEDVGENLVGKHIKGGKLMLTETRDLGEKPINEEVFTGISGTERVESEIGSFDKKIKE